MSMKRSYWLIIFIIIIIPIGLFSKFYHGIFSDWVNNSLDGIFYEIFWILIVNLFFPTLKIGYAALIVFATTCILEFLQLWHPPFLQMIRSNFIGVTILGNTFQVSDFPYYFIGSFLGFLLLSKIPEKR